MSHPAILSTSLRQSMSVRQSAERSMRGLGIKRAEMLLGWLSREMACITPPWPSGPAAAHRSEHRRSPAFAYTRHYTPSCPRLTPSPRQTTSTAYKGLRQTRVPRRGAQGKANIFGTDFHAQGRGLGRQPFRHPNTLSLVS